MDTPPRDALDAYAPREIAVRVEAAAIAKTQAPFLSTLVLALLAGAFIAFGAMFYTVVITETGLGFGPTRLLGGLAFSLGLVLVIVGGAELFTGDNLVAMAWADRRIGAAAVVKLWLVVYVGNFAGALGAAVLMRLSGALDLGGHAVGATAIGIAVAKVQLPLIEAFFRGLMCNALVCLAVWLYYAAHTVSGKILAIVMPISAFVALGFEHSIANIYMIPIGIVAAIEPLAAARSGLEPAALQALTVGGFLHNLVAVTLGNVVGGSIFVALVYYLVYRRGGADDLTRS